MDASSGRILTPAEFTDGRALKIYSRHAGKLLQMVQGGQPPYYDGNEIVATMWNDAGASHQQWRMQFAESNAMPTNTTDDGGPAVSSVKSNSQQIGVYPNPATNVLSVATPTGTDPTGYTIKLMDAKGSAIETKYIGNQIDVSCLAAGIYFITITNGKQAFHQKFSKQ